MTVSSSEPVLRTSALSKSYEGQPALEGLSLELQQGEVLGFLGPNGAGKTTTIRLLLGFLRPTSGNATVFGRDCWSQSVAVRGTLGYLPGDVRLYDTMKGRALLSLCANLRRRAGRFEELAERLDLDLDKRVSNYSKGNKQKLGIVQALMHEPKLLILDEPTSALDPLVQETVYEILSELKRDGTTIFFSSHILSEVQKVCDRYAIINDGRLVREGLVTELGNLSGSRVRVSFRDDAAGSSALARANLSAQRDGDHFVLTTRVPNEIVRALSTVDVATLDIRPLSLEEVFFESTSGIAVVDCQ